MLPLFDLLPRDKQCIAPDAWLLPNFLSLPQQRDLLAMCRELVAPIGMVHPVTGQAPKGEQLRMKVKVGSLGEFWTPDGYLEPIIELPTELVTLADLAVEQTISRYCPFVPDTAILQWYGPDASLGMHRDDSEEQPLLEEGSPIVSLSLGDRCLFRFSDVFSKRKIREDIELRSGDAVVFGGVSRLAYHGVPKIFPNTAPAELGSKGRLNITIRRARVRSRQKQLPTNEEPSEPPKRKRSRRPASVRPDGCSGSRFWFEGRLRFYQQLQVTLIEKSFVAVTTGASPKLQSNRKHEISYLQTLIDQAKEQLENDNNPLPEDADENCY